MREQPEPKVGQVWRERDNSFTRFVVVTKVDEDKVTIRTSDRLGMPRKGKLQTKAKRSRFDGKYQNYVYYGEASE